MEFLSFKRSDGIGAGSELRSEVGSEVDEDVAGLPSLLSGLGVFIGGFANKQRAR